MLSNFSRLILSTLFLLSSHAFTKYHILNSNNLSINKLSTHKPISTSKYMFGKGNPNPMKDLGGVGPQGEYYFMPSKTPTLKAPDYAIGKQGVIPIFPRNQVLGPLGEEYLGIYEMRYRQLLYDIGDSGTFGHSYYRYANITFTVCICLCVAYNVTNSKYYSSIHIPCNIIQYVIYVYIFLLVLIYLYSYTYTTIPVLYMHTYIHTYI